MGFNFQSAMKKDQIKFLYLDVSKKLVYETMANEIQSGEYDRIVLDSLTQLSEVPLNVDYPETTNNIKLLTPNDKEK